MNPADLLNYELVDYLNIVLTVFYFVAICKMLSYAASLIRPIVEWLFSFRLVKPLTKILFTVWFIKNEGLLVASMWLVNIHNDITLLAIGGNNLVTCLAASLSDYIFA